AEGLPERGLEFGATAEALGQRFLCSLKEVYNADVGTVGIGVGRRQHVLKEGVHGVCLLALERGNARLGEGNRKTSHEGEHHDRRRADGQSMTADELADAVAFRVGPGEYGLAVHM